MTDALRSDRAPGGDTSDRERDARIEELLLLGLDHYFAGQHELAINVWTRVLFLDRAHARARAYIERARGALAEKQREVEELVHSGAAALNRGDWVAARQLLTLAAERGSSGEEALTLLRSLDRLEAARPVAVPRPQQTAEPVPNAAQSGAGAGRRDARVAWVATGILTGVVLAAVAGAYLWLVNAPFDLTTVSPAAPPAVDEPLPVPASCELRLLRAGVLSRDGKLHEALALLEAGDADGLHRERFDELRAAIQRQLLEAGRRSAGFSTGGERERPDRLRSAPRSLSPRQ